MSFLAPLWLGLLAAAAIPIVLHLLRRRTGARVEFPALRFLIKAEQEHQREVRLRNLALMLVRVLAVVAIAMAAARPLGSFGGSGHAPTALAIVLDNSLSTAIIRDGEPTLTALSREAQAVVEQLAATDAVWLFTVDGGVVAGAEGVRAALDRLRPITGRGDLPAAIARAVSTVRAAGREARHLVLLTDAQASALPATVPLEGVSLSLITARGNVTPNRAVTLARTEPTRWSPRGTVTIALRSPDSTDVRVVLSDRTVARSAAGPDGTITVRAQAPGEGWIAGQVELPADELRGDDVRHFAIHAGAAPAFQVSASAGAFMDGAIATLVDGGRATRAGRIGVSSASAVGRGLALVLAPRDPVETGAANRALAVAGIPWRFDGVVREAATVRDARLEGVRVLWRYRLSPVGADSSTILARVAGEPWIVAGEGFVLVASPMDPVATSLPIDARFVPWIEQITQQFLLSDGGPIVDVAPFAMITLPLAVDERIGPDSARVVVTDRTLVAPDRPGVHWLRRAGRTVGALVVNPEPDESDLTALSPAALGARFDGGAAEPAADGAAAAAAAFSGTARRPLVLTFLLLLLTCLVAEAWIAREPRRIHS